VADDEHLDTQWTEDARTAHEARTEDLIKAPRDHADLPGSGPVAREGAEAR